MAQARIIHRWTDGTETEVEVYAEESYPQALAEVVARVCDLWRVTCGEDG